MTTCSPPPEYPFSLRERLVGPGGPGVAVGFPGPFSTRLLQDRDNNVYATSNSQLRREGDPIPSQETEHVEDP